MTRAPRRWPSGTICSILLIVLVGAAVAYITPNEQALIDWIVSEGGEVQVTIGRTPEGVRGIFTTKDVKQGELLINVPDHLVLSVPTSPAAESGPFLLKELHHPCTRLRPYMDILPKEDEVLTGYNFPDEYVKYLADDKLEHQVRDSFKLHCHTAFKGQHNENMVISIPEAIGTKNITLEHWEYVVSMLTSRTFSLRKASLSMVPLLDLMNHDVRDINQLDNTRASGVRLYAGKDLAAGEEVTITYGNMRSDELLLYYGFLDMITEPPRLLAVDHRKFKMYDQDELDDEELTGPIEDVHAEIERLQGIQDRFEARLEELGAIPESNPYLAGLLRTLHQQRRVALRNELERLRTIVGGGGAEL